MGPDICITHETILQDSLSGHLVQAPATVKASTRARNWNQGTGNKVYQRNPNRINFFCFSKYKPSLKNLKSRINIIAFYIIQKTLLSRTSLPPPLLGVLHTWARAFPLSYIPSTDLRILKTIGRVF